MKNIHKIGTDNHTCIFKLDLFQIHDFGRRDFSSIVSDLDPTIPISVET